MTKHTDPIDLDDTPLSPREVERLRRVLRDHDRASWAMRRLFPALIALAVGLWQLWDWLARHVKVSP